MKKTNWTIQERAQTEINYRKFMKRVLNKYVPLLEKDLYYLLDRYIGNVKRIITSEIGQPEIKYKNKTEKIEPAVKLTLTKEQLWRLRKKVREELELLESEMASKSFPVFLEVANQESIYISNANKLPPLVLSDEPLFVKAIKNNIKLFAKSHTLSQAKWVYKQVKMGIDQGQSLNKIANNIEKRYNTRYVAKRIAHTETFRTSNMASRDTFFEAKIVNAIKWFTTDDELVCPICSELDGREVGREESFWKKGEKVGGVELNYEEGLTPPSHPNCRCWIQPVINK